MNNQFTNEELKNLLAANLYRIGKLSLGQASTLAGMSKRTFMETLGNYNISIFDDNLESLEEDYSNA